jgi:hypothetical protein
MQVDMRRIWVTRNQRKERLVHRDQRVSYNSRGFNHDDVHLGDFVPRLFLLGQENLGDAVGHAGSQSRREPGTGVWSEASGVTSAA